MRWIDYHRLPSYGLIAAAILMPVVCFASAFCKPARHLFALPVLAVVLSVVRIFVMGVIR